MKKSRRAQKTVHNNFEKQSPQRTGFDQLIFKLLPLFAITALPLWATRRHWQKMIDGYLPRGVDGSGHYSVAQIYTEQIFPHTSGWTAAYFAGMPFPNFYPPLFFWLIAAVSNTGLVSFAVAFKTIVALPIILLPLAIWFLARRILG